MELSCGLMVPGNDGKKRWQRRRFCLVEQSVLELCRWVSGVACTWTRTSICPARIRRFGKRPPRKNLSPSSSLKGVAKSQRSPFQGHGFGWAAVETEPRAFAALNCLFACSHSHKEPPTMPFVKTGPARVECVFLCFVKMWIPGERSG